MATTEGRIADLPVEWEPDDGPPKFVVVDLDDWPQGRIKIEVIVPSIIGPGNGDRGEL